MKRGAVLFAVLMAWATVTPRANGQRAEAVPVDGLLTRVDAYLAEFAKAYAQAVAEEHYSQTLRPKRVSLGLSLTTRREIKADVVAVSDDTQTWLNFRDVFAVDGIRVRDRDERLTKLFLSESGDPLEKARVIADEGARFNLGNVSRNINFPAMALTFLATANRSRSAFRLDGHARIAGVETTIIAFQETGRPTIVKSGDVDLPVQGRFWIEPASGRVMKSLIKFVSREFSGEVDVTYGYIEKLKLWLPVQMIDWCEGPAEVVSSRAAYSNFRKFGTSAVIK